MFYRLQEKDVIDSDLVDQMISMYRVRADMMVQALGEDDYKAMQELIRCSFEDIDLFVQQVQEFISRPGKCDQ